MNRETAYRVIETSKGSSKEWNDAAEWLEQNDREGFTAFVDRKWRDMWGFCASDFIGDDGTVDHQKLYARVAEAEKQGQDIGVLHKYLHAFYSSQILNADTKSEEWMEAFCWLRENDDKFRQVVEKAFTDSFGVPMPHLSTKVDETGRPLYDLEVVADLCGVTTEELERDLSEIYEKAGSQPYTGPVFTKH